MNEEWRQSSVSSPNVQNLVENHFLKGSSRFEAALERFVTEEKHLKYFAGFAVPILIVLLIAVFVFDWNGILAKWIFQGFIVFIFLFIGLREIYERRRRLRTLESVARKLGLTRVYQDEPLFQVRINTIWSLKAVEQSLESMNARLFERGHSRSSRLLYIGEHHRNQMRIIESEYTIGWGKSSREYKYFIIELELRKAVPGVMIVPAKSSLVPKGFQKVRMESNEFESVFEVYVKDKLTHAFEILQPDDMEFLFHHQKTFCFAIETSGTRMYSVLFALPATEQEFIDFFDFSTRLSEKLLDV